MDREDDNEIGVLDSARRFGATIVATLHNRIELLTVEVQEEGLRAVNAILLLAAIIGVGFLAILAGAAAVIILLWNALGIAGLFIASGLGLAVALGGYWWLRSAIKKWRPLPGTLGELKKDREWLARKN